MDQDFCYRYQWVVVNYDGEAGLFTDSDSGYVFLYGYSDLSAVMMEVSKSNSRSDAV